MYQDFSQNPKRQNGSHVFLSLLSKSGIERNVRIEVLKWILVLKKGKRLHLHELPTKHVYAKRIPSNNSRILNESIKSMPASQLCPRLNSNTHAMMQTNFMQRVSSWLHQTTGNTKAVKNLPKPSRVVHRMIRTSLCLMSRNKNFIYGSLWTEQDFLLPSRISKT